MSPVKHKVLFVCIHNSARSQMAEAFLAKYGSENFIAESAGLEPGTLNPIVVEVMREKGIDISHKETQSVFDLFKKGSLFNAVVTVCDEASAERCPIFPGMTKRLSWSFPDPSAIKGSHEEVLKQVRIIRDKVEEKIKEFVNEAKEISYWV
ncbi:MAG TPA: arsenate reductase ArsC [Chitinophagaceae bacterium]|nr:arsenate reductase ArsC [Chitinophagaceae bacterium]